MHIVIVGALIHIVVLSGFMFYYRGIVSANDEAIGLLARAESAQTPDHVIRFVMGAKQQLPESGQVAWWSAEKGDFESIQTELDDIISRARNISSLELGNDLYNSEMYDIHAKIEAIQENLIF